MVGLCIRTCILSIQVWMVCVLEHVHYRFKCGWFVYTTMYISDPSVAGLCIRQCILATKYIYMVCVV